MSIRAIAKDLYKAQQRVQKLEGELESCSFSDSQPLTQQLRQAKQELAMLRRIMAGEKESGEMRKKFQGFGQ